VAKDLYNENYRTLKKEIDKDTSYGKTSHVQESAEFILWKWLYFQ
jgi:hypothetical protein